MMCTSWAVSWALNKVCEVFQQYWVYTNIQRYNYKESLSSIWNKNIMADAVIQLSDLWTFWNDQQSTDI